MRHPRRLIGTFLAATVLVDFGALTACGHEFRGVGVASAVFWALAWSQVSIAAIWAVLGGSHYARRIPGALLILAGWSVPINWGRLGGDFRGAVVEVSMMFATVGVPLLVVRPIGVQIVRHAEISTGAVGLSVSQPPQFTIRYLLGLMTALAVVMGIGKWLYLNDLWLRRLDDTCFLWFCAGQGPVAWAATWAALGNRWSVVRMATLVLASAAAFGALMLSGEPVYYVAILTWNGDPTYYGNFWTFFLLFSLEALLLLGSLWVFRVAGYRVGIWKTQNEDAGVT